MSAGLAVERFQLSTGVPQHFFDSRAPDIARACLAMARRFARGGRLLVFGTGAAATDAQHVAVEFMHPVIVGKRALPAVALNNDTAAVTAHLPAGADDRVAMLIGALGRAGDILMGIESVAGGDAIARGVAVARARGMLTLVLAGQAGAAAAAQADFVFLVPESDPFVVQEVHETLYHVLWELVHVFFENGVADG